MPGLLRITGLHTCHETPKLPCPQLLSEDDGAHHSPPGDVRCHSAPVSPATQGGGGSTCFSGLWREFDRIHKVPEKSLVQTTDSMLLLPLDSGSLEIVDGQVL